MRHRETYIASHDYGGKELLDLVNGEACVRTMSLYFHGEEFTCRSLIVTHGEDQVARCSRCLLGMLRVVLVRLSSTFVRQFLILPTHYDPRHERHRPAQHQLAVTLPCSLGLPGLRSIPELLTLRLRN